MDFKFYNLNITQESKTAWEEGRIKNPRFSLIVTDNQDLTLDEVEEILIENIRNSFIELKEALSVNQFIEAKIIMPSLQVCSVDKLDVIDFGINVFDLESDPTDDIVDEWAHPSELIELSNFLNAELYHDIDDETSQEEYNEDKIENAQTLSHDNYMYDMDEKEDDSPISEDELNIIKKIINGDI